MAVIPPSGIEPDWPEVGNPTTFSVRTNFASAEGSVNALKGHVTRIDGEAAAEATRVNDAIYAEANRTDVAFFAEVTRVNTQFGNEQTRVNAEWLAEQTRVNQQFTGEQTRVNNEHAAEQSRVNVELDAKAMRAGDLAGSTTVTSVRAIQTYAVSPDAPVNTPRPAAHKVLAWSGAQWAADNVHQLQGWPIADVAPVTGQYLVFDGSFWRPTTSASPDRINFLAMPTDVHDWMPIGAQGWFAADRESAGLTNNPGAGFWFYRGWSSTTGRMRIEALAYNLARAPYVKWRDENGTWSGWNAPGL